MLNDLVVDHPYYCSESNFFSNEAGGNWETATDFLDEFEDADIDMNLVFRWDVKQKRNDETDELIDGYYAEIFMMLQRKGIFKPHWISSVTEDEADRLEAYLKNHWDRMKEIWTPIGDQK